MQEETAAEIAFTQETGILRNPSNSFSQCTASSVVCQYHHAQQTQAANKASRTCEELEEQIADLSQKILDSLANCKHNANEMTPADLDAAVKERNDWRQQRLDITSSKEWNQVRKARKRRKVVTSSLAGGDSTQSPALSAAHSSSSGSSASSTSVTSFNSLASLTNTASSFSSESLQPFDTNLALISALPSTNPQSADLTFSSHPFSTLSTLPPTFSLQNFDFSYPVYSSAPFESCEWTISYLFIRSQGLS